MLYRDLVAMAVERLDRRLLLTVSVVDEVLVIEGTPGADYVEVTRGSSWNGPTEVTFNGVVTRLWGSLRFIQVQTFGGDDYVRLYTHLWASVKSGGGNDTVFGGDSNSDRVDGGAGDDELHGGQNISYVFGGAGNDKLYNGRSGGVYGGEGDDHIEIWGWQWSFSDDAEGGPGNDYMAALWGEVALRGDEGDDTLVDLYKYNVRDPFYPNQLYGGEGNDYLKGEWLFGGAGNDRLVGLSGDDLLEGGEGADSLYGGPGADTLYGHDGNDLLKGGKGDDELYGNGGQDRLWGDLGNDFLTGNDGRDSVYGGDGSDTLRSSGGGDSLDGGPGDDLIQGDFPAVLS